MPQLSKRDKQILEFLGDPLIKNHQNKVLAHKLGLTEGTIKMYLSRLTRKLNTDKIGLALYYYQPQQLVLDLRPPEVKPNECPKVEVKKIRNGSPAAACGKPIAATPTKPKYIEPQFRSDYKYKSLRPDFLEIP